MKELRELGYFNWREKNHQKTKRMFIEEGRTIMMSLFSKYCILKSMFWHLVRKHVFSIFSNKKKST